MVYKRFYIIRGLVKFSSSDSATTTLVVKLVNLVVNKFSSSDSATTSLVVKFSSSDSATTTLVIFCSKLANNSRQMNKAKE
jgi:hypothetical protein